jgi:hypothetical protein
MKRHCSKCHGAGRIENPEYPDAARARDRRYEAGFLPYPHYVISITAVLGDPPIPEEEIVCPLCKGSGIARVRLEGARELSRGGTSGN